MTGLLDARAVAKALRVSVSSLYRMISAGQLAAIKHGGKSWIEHAEINDYFDRASADAAKRRAVSAKQRRPRRRTGNPRDGSPDNGRPSQSEDGDSPQGGFSLPQPSGQKRRSPLVKVIPSLSSCVTPSRPT